MLGYDAARWHALLNDLPAALLLVAVLFDVAAAITKRESLMWAAIWTLWAGVIGGWAAVVAGKIASNTIDHGEAIHEIMEKHENMALLTMALFTVVLVDVWVYTPFIMILLLAGLRSLPTQPFEAAALDGVPRRFVFFRITLPMLTPYIITAALFRMLDSIQQFDIIYPMTQGGPGNTLLVFQVRAYLEFYQYTNVGKSAALLIILWAVTYALSNVFIKQWLKLRERARGMA